MSDREGKSLRKVKIDLMDLESAFEADPTWEASHYLDLETGKVILITGEAQEELESLYEEYDVEDPSFDIAELVRQRDLADWEKEFVIEAGAVEAGFGTRYLRVPGQDSHEGYRDMQSYIETVQNQRLQEALWKAISGQKPFRRFKGVLHGYPDERERWYGFSKQCLRERIVGWLESEGIEPVFESPQDLSE